MKQKMEQKAVKTRKEREPHYSPVRFIKEAKTQTNMALQGLFVPYSQERDGLGRLIKPKILQEYQLSPIKKREVSQESSPKLKYELTPSTCISFDPKIDVNSKVEIIQEIIDRSFEYNPPREAKHSETNPIKIKKAQSSKELPFLPSTTLYQSRINSNSQNKFAMEQIREQQMRSTRIPKSFSFRSLPSIDQHIKTQKQLIMQQLRKSQVAKTKTSQGASTSLTSRATTLDKIGSRKSTQNVASLSKADLLNYKVSSLQPYKRWPNLNGNIEKNNQLFEAKMWKSKKLVLNMKKFLREQEY